MYSAFIASSTGTDQYITKSWEYDEETKELTFDAPSDVYRVIEKKTDQFTAVRPTTNAGLIFVKKWEPLLNEALSIE